MKDIALFYDVLIGYSNNDYSSRKIYSVKDTAEYIVANKNVIITEEDVLMNEYEKLRRISKKLRENYPMGTRIMLLEMNDPQAVPSGTKGTVIAVDDMANIHMKWDNGRTLSLAGDVDKFRKLTEEELSNEKICTVKGEMTHI